MRKEVYNWINKGKRRKIIITHIKQPMTAKQLAHIIGMREDCCSYVLQELLMYQLVYCMNPQARRSRLYWITNKCKQYQKKILRGQGLAPYDYDFPIVDWRLYGWVCYSHRAAVITALTGPLQPAAIRREIKKQLPSMKISANNIADIIRLFLKKGIVKPVKFRKKAYLSYQLTEFGARIRKLLLRVENKICGK